MRREENGQKKHLECVIRYLEDKLLRSRNIYEQERLYGDLCKLRIEYSKMRA